MAPTFQNVDALMVDDVLGLDWVVSCASLVWELPGVVVAVVGRSSGVFSSIGMTFGSGLAAGRV